MRSVSAAGPAGVSRGSSVWPGAGKRAGACRGGGGHERLRAALRAKGAAARGNCLAAGAQAHCNSAATLLPEGPLLLAVAMSTVCCPCSYSTFYREQWLRIRALAGTAPTYCCAHTQSAASRGSLASRGRGAHKPPVISASKEEVRPAVCGLRFSNGLVSSRRVSATWKRVCAYQVRSAGAARPERQGRGCATPR
jgi:hypothetical protein